MDETKNEAIGQQTQVHELVNVSPGDVSEKQGTEWDARGMLRIGKKQELRREFRFISITGYAMILGCSWEFALINVVLTLSNGGKAGTIWMLLVAICGMFFVCLCKSLNVPMCYWELTCSKRCARCKHRRIQVMLRRGWLILSCLAGRVWHLRRTLLPLVPLGRIDRLRADDRRIKVAASSTGRLSSLLRNTRRCSLSASDSSACSGGKLA